MVGCVAYQENSIFWLWLFWREILAARVLMSQNSGKKFK